MLLHLVISFTGNDFLAVLSEVRRDFGRYDLGLFGIYFRPVVPCPERWRERRDTRTEMGRKIDR